jgi:hypothetical protein
MKRTGICVLLAAGNRPGPATTSPRNGKALLAQMRAAYLSK